MELEEEVEEKVVMAEEVLWVEVALVQEKFQRMAMMRM